ncbi:hypothetical protein TeGR_g788 [Tetraparma gracilis]|uniref:Uncharacterized protein n=1 Tax=Tetraparma gracilis TaxID=2962635 RepID=A0ABQ6MIN7_9STRA|nr:hypothetical protein TeGR_g788 [Tetraparma gracilis]
MADRGRVGLDLAPNKRIRDQHISTVQAIHTSRLEKISRGNGVVVARLEEKFRRSRTGAKTATIRKERADHIALENKLLVDRMKRIITHSKPVWEDGPEGMAAIKIDHLSVLRPVKTSSRRAKEAKARAASARGGKRPAAADSGPAVEAGEEQDRLEVYEPAQGATGPLEYSEDFNSSDKDVVNPLNSSMRDLDMSAQLEMSRSSANPLEASAVSVRFGENKIVNLDESYATHTGVGAVRPRPSSAKHTRPRSASAAGKRDSSRPLLPHQRPPSARRPSTAGTRKGSVLGGGASRPQSAATAPVGAAGGEELESQKFLEADKRRRSSLVGSISGLSRLRQFERIAKDNEKIVHHMSAIGAYYSNSDMAEDRQKQLDRMERFKKFRTKKGANAKIAKAGLKGIYKYADDNKAKIDEWEKQMEGRKNSESLQRAASVASFSKSQKTLKETQKKNSERAKKQYIETRRLEKEKQDKEAADAESGEAVALQVRKASAARKGLAFAANKFNKVIIRNEEKRRQVGRELSLLANAAAAQCMKHISLNKGDSFAVHNSEGIEKVRKTLVQSQQDAILNSYLAEQERKSKASNTVEALKKLDKNDYLERALMALGGTPNTQSKRQLLDLQEEDESSHITPGQPITDPAARGGYKSWYQEPLVAGRKLEVRLLKEGDWKGETKIDCRVWCDVINEENVKIVIKKWVDGDEEKPAEEEENGFGGKGADYNDDDDDDDDDDDAYENDFEDQDQEQPQHAAHQDKIGIIGFIQRIPKLIIVDRDMSISYAEQLLKKLVLKRKLLTFEQIMVGSIVKHEKRGQGTVVFIDPNTRSRHVEFDGGDIHRYLATSWHKLKLIKAKGVPHDGLWEKEWSVDIDLEKDNFI